MRKPIIYLVSALILLSFQTAYSLKEEEKENVRKQISSVKAWQLTEDLDLSEEQAQALFPTQKAYEDRNKELGEQREVIEEELDKLLQTEEKDKDLIKEKMTRLKEIDEQTRVNKDQFQGKLAKILTVEQQAKYQLFDKKFDTKLRRMIRDIQKEDLQVKTREGTRSYDTSRQEISAADKKKQSQRSQERQDTSKVSKSKKKSSSEDRSSSEAKSSRTKESSGNRSSGKKESSNRSSSRENGSSTEKSSRSQRN